jgi:hypothetical protein
VNVPDPDGRDSNGASERLDAIVAAMTPAEAKKGARLLWQLNDWLVDSKVGFVFDEDAMQAFGALTVKLRRKAAA